MIFSTCNQYSIKGIFLILLLMISTTFILSLIHIYDAGRMYAVRSSMRLNR